MKLIKIEEARPGNRVARDVTDLRGSPLFKAGTELSLELIEKLRARNVTHIFLEDVSAAPAGSTPEEIVKRQVLIEAEVDAVFADTISHPLMAALCDSAKRYLKSKIT